MLVKDLEGILEKLAPKALAEPGDNCGLLVGDPRGLVQKVLVALELTEPVLAEAAANRFDTVLTHHPLLYSPLSSVVESEARGKMVRELVRRGMNLLACHTNLDSAERGLAATAAEALGLQAVTPIRRSPAGWYKLVGFVPEESVEAVAAAVFRAGAGIIGEYDDCAFASVGTGWFNAGAGANPAVGQRSVPERVPEVRWETVVPRSRVAAAVDAFIVAHPYEEPAFDLCPVEDVSVRTGLGRKGVLPREISVAELAGRVASLFRLSTCYWSGDGGRVVRKVGLLPGSGRSLLDAGAGLDVLVTGDLTYHDAERAAGAGMALIYAPHEEFERWCLERWTETLRAELAGSEVTVDMSDAWRSPWSSVGSEVRESGEDGVAGAGTAPDVATGGVQALRGRLRLRVDGGSRGNPGPGAIGAVLEDPGGRVIDRLGSTIGVCTNNVAEYRALLAGLEMARRAGAQDLEVLADSELLVKQLRGEYRVKNEGLKPLHAEAVELLRQFPLVSLRHVPREENVEADRLVNEALDGAASAGL
jgi:dinuclear metal center YbgI/SA1388 family protein